MVVGQVEVAGYAEAVELVEAVVLVLEVEWV